MIRQDSPKLGTFKKERTELQLDCIHRGELVGIASCGCAGKPKVHWCNLLKGHCTVRGAGKYWDKTAEGLARVGKLKPCIVCTARNHRTAKQLLNKTITQWHYITVDEMARDVAGMVSKLPSVAAVAGIPRSGMLAAPLLSTLLQVPLFEASDQYGLRPLGHGLRGDRLELNPDLPILIVDDTVSRGGAMQRIKAKIGTGNYKFAAVYAKQAGMHELDYYGCQFEEPHLLEHNIANTGYILGLAPDSDIGGSGIAFDMDGVISADPPSVFNERDVHERQAYLEWVANAPLGPIVPRMYEVPLIVSYRCEYARPETEAWLARHGVKFKELRLWPDSVSARTFDGAWKAKAYAERNFGLFIESDHEQAKAIAGATGKRVLCTDTRMVY